MSPFVTGSLPLVRGRPTRFVQLNDVHWPENVRLNLIWDFVRAYKPDYLLLLGDILNMDPFDHWAKQNARKARELPEAKAYYEQANDEFYSVARKAAPKAKIVHWIGNHEAWAYRAIDAMPGEGKGYWEPENNVRDVDLWVPQRKVANLGKLHFLHGDVLKGSPRYHAQKLLTWYRRSLRYGHFHDVQEESDAIPIDVEDRHSARSCGTLQVFDPDFMGHQPHRWVHAFSYGLVTPAGLFWDQTVRLIKGRFAAEGRIYA